jgi:TRAP transporter 4TM/12TM fusion protein
MSRSETISLRLCRRINVIHKQASHFHVTGEINRRNYMQKEPEVREVVTETARLRSLDKPYWLVARVLAIGMALWQLFVLTAYPMDPLKLRAIHLALVMAIGFLLMGATKKSPFKRFTILDAILALLSISIVFYIYSDFDNLVNRTGVVPTTGDIIFGSILIILVFEITRRSTGLVLPIISSAFLAYAFWGNNIPGMFRHSGYSFQRVVSFVFGTEGIYTIPIGVSATYVFLFIAFGSFLHASGAGQVFTDLAKAVAGGTRGGPAKVAIFASALFGSISGSAVANVVTTGSFTIPLMKNIGYRPHFAGAVEAVASTGGQMMPPVMGAGAFIMAEIVGVPYVQIIVAAAIPALLYYFALFWMIDFEAVNYNLKGIPRDQLPNFWDVTKSKGYLLIPLLVLLYFLIVLQVSPIRAALVSILSILIVSMLKKESRMGLTKILNALNNSSTGMIEVAATCACAGIVIGVMGLTGLGVKFVSGLITLSGGNLAMALLLTMIVSMLLGMGVPTTPAYAIVATTAAPALIKLGVPALAAHLFVFYFACISAITPPVALAAFAGAAVAGANMWKVGFTAVKIGIAGYIVPYMFVYGRALLMMGSWQEVVQATITACIGTVCLAGGFQGWLWKRLRLPQQAILLAAAFGLIDPQPMTDAFGAVAIATVLITAKLGYYKREKVVAQETAQ